MGRSHRLRLMGAVAVVLAVLAIVQVVRARDPERQAWATFARVKEAIETGSASDLVAELHPDYDFIARWPGLFDNPDAKTVLGSGSDDPTPRSMAKRGLSFLFLQHRQNRLGFLYAIHRVTPLPDGSAEVDATIEVGAADGGGSIVDGLKQHRFVLAPTGRLFGGWKIRSHDAIDAAVPR
jgi:hypothetical protein